MEEISTRRLVLRGGSASPTPARWPRTGRIPGWPGSSTASAALLRRVGFTQEGLRPRYTWIKGEWTDDLLLGILSPSASV